LTRPLIEIVLIDTNRIDPKLSSEEAPAQLLESSFHIRRYMEFGPIAYDSTRKLLSIPCVA
jgi:hypothetical protein